MSKMKSGSALAAPTRSNRANGSTMSDSTASALFKQEAVQPVVTTTNPAVSYDGSEVIYRLLRLGSWGSPLMNLGYFRFSGVLSFLNLLSPLESAQRRLVVKSQRLLDVQPGHQVLDLACGRGQSSFIMQCMQPDAKVVGVDLLPQHVATAHTLYGNTRNLSYAVGNAMLLKYPDNSFDRIVCLEGAFHFSDRSQFLRESFRVLRPGGRLVVVDFAWKSEEDRQYRDTPEVRMVRQSWQWDDFSTVHEYQTMALRLNFRVTASLDWSAHVTKPIQSQLRCGSRLSGSQLGRKILCRKVPLYRSFSDADWNQCNSIVAAHELVQKHSNYMAFLFDKV